MTKSRTISLLPSGNVITTGTISVGDSTNNLTINSTSIKIGNVIVNSSSINVSSIYANGSLGLNGQLLASNSTGVYWVSANSSLLSLYTGLVNSPGRPYANGTLEFQAGSNMDYISPNLSNNSIRFNFTGLTGAVTNFLFVNSSYSNIALTSNIKTGDSFTTCATVGGNLVFSTTASNTFKIKNLVYVLFNADTFASGNVYLARGYAYKNNVQNYPSSSNLSIKFIDSFTANIGATSFERANNFPSQYYTIRNFANWAFFTNSVSTFIGISSKPINAIEFFPSSSNTDYSGSIPFFISNTTTNLYGALAVNTYNTSVLLRVPLTSCTTPVSTTPVTSQGGLSTTTTSLTANLSVGFDATFGYTVGDVLNFYYVQDSNNSGNTYLSSFN
jgi:hypothetical protein